MMISKCRNLLLVLLPLSLLFSSTKIPGLPVPVYVPEVLALVCIISSYGLTKWKGGRLAWNQLPVQLRFSFLLISLGVICGVVFASNNTVALGAAKTWFVIPMLLVWSLYLDKVDPKPLWLGVIGFALIQTLYGFWHLHQYHDPRLLGLFDSPNYYAAAVGPILAACLYFMARRRWLIPVAMVLLAGLLLSRSLGGLIGLGLALLVWLLRDKSLRYRSLIIGGLIILTLVGGVIGRNRFEGVKDSSYDSRIQIWTVAVYTIRLYPLSGTGLRGFERNYQENLSVLKQAPIEWNIPEPHNLVLAFWLDLGLAGLLGFTGLLAFLMWRAKLGAPYLAVVAMLGQGIVDSPLFKTEIAFLFWLYVCMLLLSLPRLKGGHD